MQDWLSIADAAQELGRRKRVSERGARRAIVGGLICEELVAACDSFWRESIPPISNGQRAKHGHIEDEDRVPSDFWRLEHAEHFDLGAACGQVPSGSWAVWSGEKANCFATDIALTGFAAACRYQDFEELAGLGSKSVTLSWTAIGVAIHRRDLEQLISRRGGEASWKRAQRRVTVSLGNTTKSDAMRVIARFCATFLSIADQEELASNPELILKALKSVTDNLSQEQAVSDRVMRSFAKLVSEEAGKLSSKLGQIAPTG